MTPIEHLDAALREILTDLRSDDDERLRGVTLTLCDQLGRWVALRGAYGLPADHGDRPVAWQAVGRLAVLRSFLRDCRGVSGPHGRTASAAVACHLAAALAREVVRYL